ncbi:translation initiation factor IF-2 [Nocardiopsis sp. CC223A]|uniref:translation initiation factor IF-2 n=1 Tax=Nocardiopsis sp. CC223A TaxID=3044051 RepID=UPI00278C6464|nr:translation initiation factor IF-2 [Nocardiopsis sp. CC223A]
MSPPTNAWQTLVPDREVLAVARSVPAAGRLLDVCGLFHDRVGITFTVPPGSRSEPGLEEMLRRAGFDPPLPWEQALLRPTRYRLALAASTKGGLHRLPMPLLTMPHGAGHNRQVGDLPGSLEHASGLDPRELLHGGRVVPTRMAFSHPEQVERLARTCPPAAGRGVVVGDPAFDRMLAALGRRDRYRELLGVGDRRLVVLSSTWNPGSLLGSQRETVRALLAGLPHDEYRVALVAHPNVWFSRRRGEIEQWFADDIEAGLVLVPPFEGWRAAMIAADLVVGDAGSTTYYAAAIGRPVLLAAFDDGDLDPASPLPVFGAATPRLHTGPWAPPPEEQVAKALRASPAGVGDLLIAHPGGSAARLRSLVYGLLELPEPAEPAHYRPLPDPEGPAKAAEDVTAWRVEAEATGTGLRLRRFPAGVRGPVGRALVVDAEDAVMTRWESADAWSARRSTAPDPALAWAHGRLERYPKAALAVAAVDGGALVLHRSGAAMRVRAAGEGPDAAVLAAAAVAWSREGRPWREWHGEVQVEVGGRTHRLRGSPPPRDFRFLGADGSERC